MRIVALSLLVLSTLAIAGCETKAAKVKKLQDLRRKKQVLREIHFHAVALPNRDGGRYLYETIKDRGGRLRNTAGRPVGESLRTASRDGAATLCDLARPGDHTQSY